MRGVADVVCVCMLAHRDVRSHWKQEFGRLSLTTRGKATAQLGSSFQTPTD